MSKGLAGWAGVAANPDDPHLIPKTHMEEGGNGGNQFSHIISHYHSIDTFINYIYIHEI